MGRGLDIYIKKLEGVKTIKDHEYRGIEADKVLCDFLRSVGGDELVTAFEEAKKGEPNGKSV